MTPFVFVSDVLTVHSPSARVVEIPMNVIEKGILFSWYAVALEFPDYFGRNWDAFDECLRDLSWLKERRVILYHRDVPFKNGSKDQKIYIDVLANAVQDWGPGEEHELIAGFPPVCEPYLIAAWNSGELES